MPALNAFWGTALKNKAGNIGKPVSELLPLLDELWKSNVQGVAGLPGASELLQKFNFPGRIALLTIGQSPRAWPTSNTLNDLIEAAVVQALQKQRIMETNIQSDILTRAITGIFAEGRSPRDWFEEWGVRGELAETIGEVAKRHGFPDLVSGGTFTDLIVWRTARLPALKSRGIPEAQLATAFTLLTNHGNPLTGLFAGDLGQNLPLVLEEAAKELALPLTEEEARTAVELLLTGEFFRDAAASIQATLQAVPQLLLSAPQDVVSLPWRIFGLANAIVTGLIKLPGEAPHFVLDLVKSGAPKSPALLTQTLQWLYSNGTFRSASDLVWELTAPDNESLRLALIVFARAHGVPVTPELLDGARMLFRTDTPELGPVIQEGVNFLKERFGDRVLESFKPFLMNS
jgi:hypothetical protein